MTTIATLPLATYPAGTTTIPEFAIGDGVSRLTATGQRNTSADLTIWPLASTSVSLLLDFFDGTTWLIGVYGWSDVGGLRLSHGAEVSSSVSSWPLPPGTGRKLRGAVTVAGGSVRTSAVVDGS